MKLSARARYGLRLCFLIGLSGETVSLTTLVKQTDLSKKYLEQILSQLRSGGVIGAVRGVNGGYYLLRTPAEVTIKDVLSAVDDTFEITDCIAGNCNDIYCPNRRIFKRLYDDIDKLLQGTTLQDMIDDYKCI